MTTTTHTTTPNSNFLNHFLAWLKQPMDVASICPSSGVLTSMIANRPSVAHADLVVDLGPANGETCRALLNHMKPGSTLLAIEQNRRLAQSLLQIEDDRLIGVHGDAKHLGRLLKEFRLDRAGVIVSGIPFSSLEPEEADQIMMTIYQSLRPGGQFIAYQLRSTVAKYASKHLLQRKVTWVWRNIPPLRVFVWTKSDASASAVA